MGGKFQVDGRFVPVCSYTYVVFEPLVVLKVVLDGQLSKPLQPQVIVQLSQMVGYLLSGYSQFVGEWLDHGRFP